MPRPSRLATFTANELTSWCSAIACSTPKEPSTAAPPTRTGSAAATNEPKMNSSSTSTIGSEIASATARSLVDRLAARRPSAAPPATSVLAPSTLSRSLIARNDSSLLASSAPASVSTATALDLVRGTYCAASSGQYDVQPAHCARGSAASRFSTRWPAPRRPLCR